LNVWKILKVSCLIEITGEYCRKIIFTLPKVIQQQLGEVGKFIIFRCRIFKMHYNRLMFHRIVYKIREGVFET